MGERALVGTPTQRSLTSGRSLLSWLVLLALIAIALLLALGFLPSPPPGGARLVFGAFASAELLAPVGTLLPGRGAAVAAVLALALAAIFAAARLEPAIGPHAPLWIAVWIGVSGLVVAVFWTPAAAILMAAGMLAWTLVLWEERPAPEYLPEVWRGESSVSASWLRCGAAGLLLGLLGASHPVHLLQLVAAVWAVGGRQRRSQRWALLVGASVVLAVLFLRGGLAPWAALVAAPSWSPKLFGWNLLYLAVGRNVAVLLIFPALVLLLWGAGKGRGRQMLLAFVAAELLLLALLQPFDFAGGPSSIGNRNFLPLYGALALVLGRPVRRTPALLVAALGLPLLWPLLQAPRAHPLNEEGRYRWTRGLVAEYMPFETSLRGVPGAPEVNLGGVRLRTVNDAIWPVGSAGSLRLLGGARGELLLASRVPLGSLLIEFAREAKGSLEVGGGEVGETIFRPDGGIAFEVLLRAPRAVHPTAWSRSPWYFYVVTLRLPGAPARPVALSIAPQEKPG